MSTASDAGAIAVVQPVGDAGPPDSDAFQARKSFVVAGGHLAHDIYGAFLGVLIPWYRRGSASPLPW